MTHLRGVIVSILGVSLGLLGCGGGGGGGRKTVVVPNDPPTLAAMAGFVGDATAGFTATTTPLASLAPGALQLIATDPEGSAVFVSTATVVGPGGGKSLTGTVGPLVFDAGAPLTLDWIGTVAQSNGAGDYVWTLTLSDGGAETTVTATITVGGAPTPTPGLFYVADAARDEAHELFVVRPPAAPARLSGALTLNGAVVLGPGIGWEVSPDREWIWFIADKTTDETFELYVASTSGMPIEPVKISGTLVAGGDVQRAAWSPDSSTVVFVADARTDEQIELFAAARDGSTLVRLNGDLIADGDVDAFQVLPNGSRMVYAADQATDGILQLYSTLLDGTGPLEISGALPTGATVRQWQVSPSGSRVAYIADEAAAGVLGLYTTSPHAAGDSVLVSGAFADPGAGNLLADPIWAPDGSRIACRADADTRGLPELFTTSPIGPAGWVKVSAAVAGPSGASSVAWAPNSSRLAYLGGSAGGSDELFTATPTTAADSVRVCGALPVGAAIERFGWAPDSSRIAYLADQDTVGVDELYSTLPTTAGGVVKLNGPVAAPGRIAAFRWAPDSSRVAYIGSQVNPLQVELFTAPAAGGAWIEISNLPASANIVGTGDAGFRWSSDSMFVYYRANQASLIRPELFRSPAAANTPNPQVSGPITVLLGQVAERFVVE